MADLQHTRLIWIADYGNTASNRDRFHELILDYVGVLATQER